MRRNELLYREIDDIRDIETRTHREERKKKTEKKKRTRF